jgi:anti-sigma-K factor RskA
MADAMTCDEATDLLALDAVGALEPSDREIVERHLATCATCPLLAAQYADVASILPAALEPVPPPARLRRQLMAQVYAEATAVEAQLPWWRRLVAAIPANRAFTAAGAAAVVVAIALGVWGATGRQAATPLSREYMVSGTTASGALAVDTVTNQAVLTVQGLDPLPASKVYEVWLIPDQGSPKGVAFLSPRPSGGAWTAVVSGSLSGYKSIAATVEPAGGSPTPSQTVVLSGQLVES